METQTRCRVLVVYYTFSKQTERVADVISETLGQRGAEVTKARVVLTDKRWAARFERIPMRFPVLKIVGMLPVQLRQTTGEIGVPPEAQDGEYDLVLIGSPTWWFRVSLPIRTYLKSDVAKQVLTGKPFAAFSTSRRYWKHNVGEIQAFGEEAGGTWVGETHFVAQGNQVQSMVSWLSYMSGFSWVDRLFGLPPTNLRAGFEAQAQAYANSVADRALPGRLSAAAEAPAS